jgi:hypothetical protein
MLRESRTFDRRRRRRGSTTGRRSWRSPARSTGPRPTRTTRPCPWRSTATLTSPRRPSARPRPRCCGPSRTAPRGQEVLQGRCRGPVRLRQGAGYRSPRRGATTCRTSPRSSPSPGRCGSTRSTGRPWTTPRSCSGRWGSSPRATSATAGPTLAELDKLMEHFGVIAKRRAGIDPDAEDHPLCDLLDPPAGRDQPHRVEGQGARPGHGAGHEAPRREGRQRYLVRPRSGG